MIKTSERPAVTSMPIQTCPRCGRAVKDDSPLGKICRLSSADADRAWEAALNIGLGHDCTRYMLVDFRDGGGWSSDWPGYTGPADLLTAEPPGATCTWVEGGPNPDTYPDRASAPDPTPHCG